MAGAGYKLFNTGDVLTAAQVNTYLQEQTVMVFASAAARTTALSGVLAEGMISYLTDTDLIQYYNGSAWTTVNTDQTPLTTKGDLFTYSTTDARLAVGNNGETLVADSSATTGLRWQGNYAAAKNKILNSDFSIWQRGASFSNMAMPGFTADRWQLWHNGSTAGTTTYSQQTFTPGSAPVAGYEGQYFLRAAFTTLGTGQTVFDFWNSIEDVRTFAGQTVTLSFWMKSSTAWTPQAFIAQNFGSGGSTQVDTTLSISGTTSTSWQRFTATVAVPSVSGKTIGSGSYIRLQIRCGSVSNGQTIDIWGVQLEAGNTATAFQTATGNPATELAACQRYYEASSLTGATNGPLWSGNSTNGVVYYYAVIYKAIKRTNATITIVNSNQSGFAAPTASSADGYFRLTATANATTNGAYFTADVWNASAEL